MVKLQNTGKQYYITLSEELVKRMNWKKGEDLFISKGRNEEFLYIEKNRNIKRKNV
jgi:hypothetical protein